MENYLQDIQDLLTELREITIQSMAASGVKSTSDLSKSVQWYYTKDGVAMKVAEYYPWVSDGHKVVRRAGVSKVPVDALIEWIKKRNIIPTGKKTINQLAFAIQTSIYKRGIKSKLPTKGKGYADKVAENVADYTAEELANYLATEIADDLVEMFAPVAI